MGHTAREQYPRNTPLAAQISNSSTDGLVPHEVNLGCVAVARGPHRGTWGELEAAGTDQTGCTVM